MEYLFSSSSIYRGRCQASISFKVYLLGVYMKKLIAFVSLLSLSATSYSAISIDRTRVIYNQENKSVSIFVHNRNEKLPYLAQAWVEDEKGEKISEPFITTPPLQRLEPSASSQIKIQLISDTRLATDRESLFYFNVREIPPKSNSPNTLQLSLQTKVKLFYRPDFLKVKSGSKPYQNNLQIKIDHGFRLINSTPYYIAVTNVRDQDQHTISELSSLNIAPKSESSISSNSIKKHSSLIVSYVNDFGATTDITLICTNNLCKMDNK